VAQPHARGRPRAARALSLPAPLRGPRMHALDGPERRGRPQRLRERGLLQVSARVAALPPPFAEAGPGRAVEVRPWQLASPPLVLGGHAASLTPYQLDTPRPSPRARCPARCSPEVSRAATGARRRCRAARLTRAAPCAQKRRVHHYRNTVTNIVSLTRPTADPPREGLTERQLKATRALWAAADAGALRLQRARSAPALPATSPRLGC
jgi:hypothetical protein